MKQKSCTPVGGDGDGPEAEKSLSETPGSPVVNMWWTHSAKLRKPVPTGAGTTRPNDVMGRREGRGRNGGRGEKNLRVACQRRIAPAPRSKGPVEARLDLQAGGSRR